MPEDCGSITTVYNGHGECATNFSLHVESDRTDLLPHMPLLRQILLVLLFGSFVIVCVCVLSDLT